MKEKKYWIRLGCILLAIFTVYFIVTGLTYTFGTHEEIVIGIQNGEANVPVGEITMETVVEQMFPAVDDTVEVSVLFATYARTNTGNVVVKITGDSSGNTYFSNTYDASLFEDNQYVDFRLSAPVKLETDSILRLTVTSDSVSGSAITAWSSSDDEIEGTLMVSGQTMPGDLALRVKSMRQLTYWNTKRVFQLFYVVLLSFLIAYIWPTFYEDTRKYIQGKKQVSLQPLRDDQDRKKVVLSAVLLFV